MFGRLALATLGAFTLALPAPARAEGYAFAIDIRAQPLSAALRELARQTRTELLFDTRIVATLRAPRLAGRLTTEAALGRLLAGTDLAIRRSTSGPWIIERRAAAAVPVVFTEDLPIPEILVVGRRSDNADIRRRENDIQPYRVTTREQLITAHRDTLDQYFASRVPSNTQFLPPSLVGDGRTNSAINLRGLGTGGTLILIDGRRMPGIPIAPGPFNLFDDPTLEMMQPDLNAIPFRAIERVETLTGTAGGIYGFGALGGVVNVVLKRDYRGAEVHLTSGLSARGDAFRYSIDGRIGFTPDEGRTDVMLAASRARADPLLVGQRGYTARNRRAAFRLIGDRYTGTMFDQNAVGVFDLGGAYGGIFGTPAAPLILKPEHGGGNLGSNFTMLPLGFAGTPAEAAAILARNAGRYDLSLTQAEAVSEMGAHAEVTSVIGDLRHSFASGFEGYLQALVLRNRGRTLTRNEVGFVTVPREDPNNPFENDLWVTFPAPMARRDFRTAISSERYTAGFITNLPWGWRGIAEASFSTTRNTSNTAFEGHDLLGTYFPDLNPLGNWTALQAAAASHPFDFNIASRTVNHGREQSLRLAGPVFEAPGGPATLTLLAERRREKVPAFAVSTTGVTQEERLVAARRTATTSYYAELRTRVFGEAAPLPVLRGLEFQLAVRHDRQAFAYFSAPPTDLHAGDEQYDLSTRFSGTAYTAGTKVNLMPWLLLRGSYATGEQPPSLASLVGVQGLAQYVVAFDPKRGDEFVINIDGLQYLSGGSPNLKTIKAGTLSLGLVFEPDKGPRISLDYSRIRKTRDVLSLSDQLVLDHENDWPQRVVRAPLTEEDRALGYTAGLVTRFDARAVNAVRVTSASLEGRIDWTFPLLGGAFHPYAAATLQLRNRRGTPFEARDEVGYFGSPVKWRANVGADWTAGSLTVGANVQFYSHYRIYGADISPLTPELPAFLAAGQGSSWVAAQTYLDLYVSKRFPVSGGREASLGIGVVNLFDAAPPREFDYTLTAPAYSRFGDPRRRRFELVLSAGF